MFEAARLQSARHRENGSLDRRQRPCRLPFHADAAPQSGDSVPQAFRHLARPCRQHADNPGRELERLNRPAEVEHASRNGHATRDARPLEEIAGGGAPYRGPPRGLRSFVGLHVECDLPHGHP